jgi:molybdopterin biosynthesis enzyme
MVVDSSIQRISQLTPRGAVLASFARNVSEVRPQTVAVAAAINAVLAEDVIVSTSPLRPVALRDGFPVKADDVADATPYAPVTLPDARPIELGEALPEGADAVLPHDVVTLRGDCVEAIAGLAAGDGVLPEGGNANSRAPMRRAGEKIRAIDVAVFLAAGVTRVAVRMPRIAVAYAHKAGNDSANGHFQILSCAIRGLGGVVADEPISLEEALAKDAIDGVIGVGGTGSGQRDASVNMLGKFGRVETHGIAITPGQTAAFGSIGERPVLLLPGRFDAMLAAWLLIGRYLIAGLSGGNVDELPTIMALKRKITSTIGMTELIPARCVEGLAEPMASGYLSLTSLVHSDGWIEVPAASEGFADGTLVPVNRWP